MNDRSLVDDVVRRDERVDALMLVYFTLDDRTDNMVNMVDLTLLNFLALVNNNMLLGQIDHRVTLRGELTNENILVGWSRDVLLLYFGDGNLAIMMLLDTVLSFQERLNVSL